MRSPPRAWRGDGNGRGTRDEGRGDVSGGWARWGSMERGAKEVVWEEGDDEGVRRWDFFWG